MTIIEGKARLRIEMKARRASLSQDERERAARQISANLVTLQIAKPCVGVYLAKGDEANVDDFITQLFQIEFCVAAPVYEKNRAPRFARIQSIDELRVGGLGLRMPREGAPEIALQNIDVLFVPGLAFDKRGARLGYGGGWYDKVRPNLNANCLLIGVGYNFQLLDEIPFEAHDLRVNTVVTPSQIFHA